MITVKLTVEQCLAVEAALKAEINRGSGTFLPAKTERDLVAILADLTTQRNLDPKTVEERITAAVEQYCDASNYDSYYELTPEDIESIAGDLQIAPAELAQFLDLVDGVTV